MKRYFLLIISAMMFSIAGYSLPNASVLLQHKGNVIVYHMDSLQAALRDAVDGDTLFLSEGKYSDITINKKITLRGEGSKTIVKSIRIEIPDTVTLTSTLLEGLNICASDGQRNIVVAKSVNGLTIKQCYFESIDFYGIFRDVLIDRCLCNGSFKFPNKEKNSVKSMIVKNTRISELYPLDITTKDISFINCDIKRFYYFWHSYASDFRGSLINCIVGDGSTQTPLQYCTLINTLLDDFPIRNTANDQNCYIIKIGDFDELFEYYGIAGDSGMGISSFRCIYSDEELLEKGYIGNDGTIVGSNGGTTPYTLDLAVPYVKASDIKLDSERRVLNVKLTISAK